MKKGAKKKVIDTIEQKAFAKQIFTEVYIEAEKDYVYFGKMEVSDEYITIPLEVMFTEDSITFYWWYNVWARDVEKFCEKMRNYILGFTHGFFKDAYVSVDEDCANEGKIILEIDFN